MPLTDRRYQEIVNHASDDDPSQFLIAIDQLDTEDLRAIASRMFNTGYAGERLHARRAAVLAVLSERLLAHLIAAMDSLKQQASRLDKAGQRLQIAAILVAIVGAVLAGVQIWIAMLGLHGP